MHLKTTRPIEKWIRKIEKSKRGILYLIPIFLISMLHGSSFNLPSNLLPDPYPQVYESINPLPFNSHGWYQHAKVFEKIFHEHEINNIIEVGSWLGSSTRHLAQLIPKNGKVFAIDHWLGSKEHFTLDEVKGWIPNLYEQFLSNVIHAQLTDKIIPVRMESLDAAKLLENLTIPIDLVYIDASHEYDPVYADLCAWYPYVKNHGILCGDDWNVGDVQQAVIQFAQENHLIIYQIDGFWRLIEYW